MCTDCSTAQIGISGAVLAVLTTLVVLAALSMRSGIVSSGVLAIIFIPLERLCALHPRRVLRQGWRTDLVHYLVNGAALKLGLVVSVVVVGGVLRVLVQRRCAWRRRESGLGADLSGIAIAMVGGSPDTVPLMRCRCCGDSTGCITVCAKWTGLPLITCIPLTRRLADPLRSCRCTRWASAG